VAAWQREVLTLIDAALDGRPVVGVVVSAAGRVRCDGANAEGALGDVLPFADGSLSAVSLTLLDWRSAHGSCRPLLTELRRVLARDGQLVVVDHNRPRGRIAALAALLRTPAPAGASPQARWRRLAHPVAREAQAAGFVVESLRLAAGERVQVVSALRSDRA
jgi:hypothetical protein